MVYQNHLGNLGHEIAGSPTTPRVPDSVGVAGACKCMTSPGRRSLVLNLITSFCIVFTWEATPSVDCIEWGGGSQVSMQSVSQGS